MARRLLELRVRDLGVVDDVTVTLGPGMTALTGETGAGKTLLVEALTLLLGGRADPALVRAGASEALVEGRFVDDDVEGDGGETILARSVAAAGRSRAWVDGRMASAGALAEAGGALVELHGQHQHQSLVRAAAQRDALDAYGDVHLEQLDAARSRLRLLLDESEALGGDAHRRAREADLVRYQLDEIEAAAIEDAVEDERLEVEDERLASAAAHRQAAAEALDVLAGADEASGLDRLADASRVLGGRPPLAELDGRVRAVMAELADLATELRSVVETWDSDPARLEQVRARRHALRELQRKYGDTLEDVLAFADGARERLAELELAEQRARAVDAEVTGAREALDAAAAEVAAARRAAAPLLGSEVETTLRTLAMPSARFEVSVEGDGAADRVTLLLGANPGEPTLPLAKVASGGELARTMLALRLALADAPGVLVFDEVDAGIGGAVATAVGEALAALGRTAQVLVVTHLAQVAAQADHQVAVRKVEREGRTVSEVSALDGDDRVVELARMLSGSPGSATAHEHARELLGSGRSSTRPTRPIRRKRARAAP